MGTSEWSTPQLAEFVAAVSAAESEATAALAAVERAAEALDADVAAILADGELVAAIGYPEGAAPIGELEAVRPGIGGSSLEVPGTGPCAAMAVLLEYPVGGTLVVARPQRLTHSEAARLRGMAQVASMTMRTLQVLGNERAARKEVERLAREQAALRGVATLVAEAASPAELFAAVAEEVGQLFAAESSLLRYDPEGTATAVGTWSATSDPLAIGTRFQLGGHNAATLVFETGRPARIDRYRDDDFSPATTIARNAGGQTAVGAPITVAGRLWGAALLVGPEALPADAEEGLADFAELVATAIANAEAQAELTASRTRIVATGDATRRRIAQDLHDGAQQRLVKTIITLKLARRAQERENAGSVEALVGEALDHAEHANQALRELVHGILPSALALGGLASGIEESVSHLDVPVSVNLVRDRFAPEIEANAYFVVAEALTNVAKHSRAQTAEVNARVENGVLHVAVRDDGVGDASPEGSGLMGIRDRVLALGGTLIIESPRGAGTRIDAEFPLSAPTAADHDELATAPPPDSP